MWTLKSTRVEPTQNALTMDVTAVMTDGTKDQTINFTVSTISEVKSTIVQNLKRLNERDEVIAKINEGTFSIENEPAPAVPKDVQDRQTWFNRYGQLVKAQELINLGVLTGTETAIVNTQTWLKANFKIEYLSDL